MAKQLMTTDEFRDELVRQGRGLTVNSSRVRVLARAGAWVSDADAERLKVSPGRVIRREAGHALVAVGVYMGKRKFFTAHDIEIVLAARQSRGRPPKAGNVECPACKTMNVPQRVTCRKCGFQLRERLRAPKKSRKGVIAGGE